jgi:branched-chain amino acid transport system ATP-binding protein
MRNSAALPERDGRSLMADMDGGVLESKGVTVRFGGVVALDKVDFTLHKGDILGLIGPNGAGKTTLVNVLTGFQTVSEGSVLLNGRDITKANPMQRVRAGVCRSFQSTRLFSGLSVRENIEVGGLGIGLSAKATRSQAQELIQAFDLDSYSGVLARALPHGVQRRVGIVRALSCRPTFLLLDEPAAGLDEVETDHLLGFIRNTQEKTGCGIVVIEHDMRVILGLCAILHVLDFGKTIAVGDPDVVCVDPAVVKAYLGEEELASA